MARVLTDIIRWFDTSPSVVRPAQEDFDCVDWLRVIPLILVHVCCLGVLYVGWSTPAVVVAIALYFLRMFAITGWYHRYFSHRTFKTSRALQFFFAVLGNAAMQRGPLWWAAHHRHHHRHADTEDDLHSPKTQGFWWSHLGWLTSRGAFPTNYGEVKDLARYPELRFLDRFDTLVPILLAGSLHAFGELLAWRWPEWGSNGLQMLVWGFFISTIVLLHGTFTINSLGHLFGTRRFDTKDDSRNSFVLALITLGEGWHNNHHRYPGVTRQGLYWWEIDITYYVLWLLSACGLIWDLKKPPASAWRS
jgi:stearoyl-CoA desaturase (delta-9 desaturase)